MFEFQFHFQSQFQFADGTTADGSYQRPSYTVAGGGVLFQLLTCTTAGTRSIVTLSHCCHARIVYTATILIVGSLTKGSIAVIPRIQST